MRARVRSGWVFGTSTRLFELQTAAAVFVSPETVLARTKIIDYFSEL